MKIKNIFFAGVVSVMFASCLKPPDYNVVPQLTFDSLRSDYIHAGDSVFMYFSFTDGDGNLGAIDSTPNTFITDSRLGGPPIPYSIPNITPDGNVKAISGQIRIYIPAEQLCDTVDLPVVSLMNFKIYMNDRAGNQSNTITTSDFTLDCH